MFTKYGVVRFIFVWTTEGACFSEVGRNDVFGRVECSRKRVSTILVREKVPLCSVCTSVRTELHRLNIVPPQPLLQLQGVS